LSIPELLELILVRLDMRTLLLSQGVCRTWQTIITRCPHLQRALYFQPCRSSPPGTTSQDRPLNPLFQSIISPYIISETGPKRPNPATIAAISEPTASWRRMLIRQPPTSLLTVV
ncbi:hypothetical protein BO70DRAFT_260192, partial [Aspergillus heteromorphus CBS 117.55]